MAGDLARWRAPSPFWCAMSVAYTRKSRQITSGEGARRRSDRCGKGGFADEIAVDGGGAGPAFGDGPHDEALAAAHVAGDEDAGHVGHELRIAGYIATSVERHAEAIEPRAPLRPGEAEGQQHQLTRQLEVGAVDLLE